MNVIEGWMIYGANGYTGELVAREAVRRGHRPVLAGRTELKLLDLAAELDLPHQTFSLDHPHKVKEQLKTVGLVLNCAGPFSQTAAILREACLAAGVHYLDITGEIEILESSYALHEEARRQGVVIISGVGFDVVPTDVLAAALQQQLPTASHLELAFASDGGVSPGTAKTVMETVSQKGRIRRDGLIEQVPLAFDCKNIDYADETRYSMSIPWGDVVTAYYTTGIPNIGVYTAATRRQAKQLRRLNVVAGLLKFSLIQRLAKYFIAKYVEGPSLEERNNGYMQLWGKVWNEDESVEMTMRTPDGYSFTIEAALMFVEALLAHKVMPGAYTPAQVFPLDVFTQLSIIDFNSPSKPVLGL